MAIKDQCKKCRLYGIGKCSEPAFSPLIIFCLSSSGLGLQPRHVYSGNCFVYYGKFFVRCGVPMLFPGQYVSGEIHLCLCSTW